jgi:hypothetical protein
MKEDSKNETVEFIDVKEVIVKDLKIKVERLQQQVIDKENEMVRMEKYFKHAYMMLVLEAMIGMPIIGFVGAYLITTK